jgi:DNA-binding NarL/FixJ family response regulator
VTTRVLLVDDHRVVLEGLHGLIEREPGMLVVGEHRDGAAAIEATRVDRPDVVVMDVAMPGLNGVDATRLIVSESPSVKVLCLSMHSDRSVVSAVLEAGASGYLVKDCAGAELINAIREVSATRVYLSPQVAGGIVDQFLAQRAAARDPDEPRLSVRERQVLQLIAEGYTTKRVAARLFISPKTVATHRDHIKSKLGLSSVAELTKYAVRNEITSAQFGVRD